MIVLDHLTEEQRRAYRLADNKLTELGAWDEALLAGELQELAAEDFDLSFVGFSDAELDQLLAFDAGDGRHARRRGRGPRDAGRSGQPAGRPLAARAAPAALRRRDGHYRPRPADGGAEGRPLLHRQPLQRGLRRRRRGGEGRQGPAHPERRARRWLRALPLRRLHLDHRAHRAARSTCACRRASCTRLQKAFVAAGGHWSTFIIWAKDRFTLGRSDYQRQFEPILYGWPEGAKHHWCGARDQGDVWFIDRPTATTCIRR